MRANRQARLLVPLLGLLAAWLIIVTLPIPRLPTLSLGGLFFLALNICVSAVTAAGATVILGSWLFRNHFPAILVPQTVQGVAICALWLPPLRLFYGMSAELFLVPGLVLLVCVVRLLLPGPPDGVQDPPFRFRKALAAAIGLQCAAVLEGIGRSHLAALVFALTGGLVLWWLWPPVPPRLRANTLTPSRQVSLLVAAAVLLTLAGLSRFLKPGAWGLGGDGLGGLLAAKPAAKKPEANQQPSGGVSDLGPSFPGIILIPESESFVRLMPPMPMLDPELRGRGKTADPLTIPFAGAYYLFRPPDTEPPPTSLRMRGTPDRQGFLSNDGVSLRMEARQNLGAHILLHCCREIRLQVKVADPDPASITLELILIDSALPERPFVLAGRKRLRSPAVLPGPPVVAYQETIDFSMPWDSRLQHFDEVVVRYVMGYFRRHRSAKVSIERLVLVPG